MLEVYFIFILKSLHLVMLFCLKIEKLLIISSWLIPVLQVEVNWFAI
jgi:hypothetical protein